MLSNIDQDVVAEYKDSFGYRLSKSKKRRVKIRENYRKKKKNFLEKE